MNPKFQLVINFMEDGTVQVSGPINDKILCYGLLESARDAIRDFKQPLVQAANALELVTPGNG